MKGKEVIRWIEENAAENDEIYIEVRNGLFTVSREFIVLGSEDCPCVEMVVLR